MPSTDVKIKNAKSKETGIVRLADEKGLYIFINQTGKYFRFDYRFAGIRKL